MGKYKKSESALIYAVFLIGYLLQISSLPDQRTIFKYIGFAFYGVGYMLGIVKLTSQRWSLHAKKCAVIMIGIAALVFALNWNIGLEARLVIWNLVWVLLCCKNTDLDSIVKLDLTIRIPFTAFLYALCKKGFLTNVVAVRNYSRKRFAWGYGHPNTTGSVYFLIALYLMYVRRKKLSFIDLAIQTMIAGWIYRVPNSQTSFAGTVLVMLYTASSIVYKALLKYKVINKLKKIKKMIIGAPVIIFSLMFALSAIYTPSSRVLQIINRLLTSRLEQGKKILAYYQPTLFGNNVVRLSWMDALEAGVNTAVVGSDILFLYVYTSFGIVSLAMFIFILVKNFKYSMKSSFCLTYCMGIILILSCVENQYVNIGSNVFLICFAFYIYAFSKPKAFDQYRFPEKSRVNYDENDVKKNQG